MLLVQRDRDDERFWGGLMANMMQGLQLEGDAASGYGVRISGFYAPTLEVPERLAKQVISPHSSFRQQIVQCEANGYVMFLLCESEAVLPDEPVRLAVFRREPHLFFSQLSRFLFSLRARQIKSAALSESYGAVTLTLLYRAAPESGDSHG